MPVSWGWLGSGRVILPGARVSFNGERARWVDMKTFAIVVGGAVLLGLVLVALGMLGAWVLSKAIELTEGDDWCE